MTKLYRGYTIECKRNESWDGSFKGKTLVIYKPTSNGIDNEFLLSRWWDGKVAEGIKYGKEHIDTALGEEAK